MFTQDWAEQPKKLRHEKPVLMTPPQTGTRLARKPRILAPRRSPGHRTFAKTGKDHEQDDQARIDRSRFHR
ncbi:hypothetical protein, partial [Streptomyces sp. NRRL F-5122]|uniref:hypothetical protein n=1 Tax=Streptomyces sp. NRRL F-5122 TaxID=1609098 RepID=UPI001F19E647